MKIRQQAFLAAVVVIGAGGTAAAQLALPEPPVTTAPEQMSVLQRPRPDFDPIGIRAGGFVIDPTLSVQEIFDSNVYATPNDVKGDFYTDLQPGVAIHSDWNNHALNVILGGEIKRYDQQSSEDVGNALAAVTGRVDVLRDFYFLGSVSYQLEHEDRSTPDTLYNQKNPTQYQLAGIAVAGVYQSGRVGLRLDETTNYFTYDNGITTLGMPIDETFRDRFEYTVTPQVSYEIVPGYSAFIKTPVNWVQFQSQYDIYGYNQSSYGYQVDAGAAIHLSNLINGEVYAGYLEQQFDGGRSPSVIAAGLPPLQPASGVSFGSNLLWNVTELTSIRGALGRAVLPSFFVPAVGDVAPPGSYVESSASVSVEHEVQRNILLTGMAGFINDAWQGNPRDDNNYQVDLGVRYLINRYLNAALNASYRQRASNAAGAEYQREVVTARLNTQF